MQLSVELSSGGERKLIVKSLILILVSEEELFFCNQIYFSYMLNVQKYLYIYSHGIFHINMSTISSNVEEE